MSNVFSSTDSMLQNLSQARSQLEDSKVNVLEDKEKPELIGKTLGEAKTFITGSSIAKAVGPKLKKFVIQKVKGRVEQAKGQLESKVKNALKGKEKPPAEEPEAAEPPEPPSGALGKPPEPPTEPEPPAEPVAPVEPVAEDLPFGASAEEINSAAADGEITAATRAGTTAEQGAAQYSSGGLAETSFGSAGRDAASKLGTDSSSITEESMNAGRAGVGESGISDTLNAIGRGAGKLLDGARQIIFGAKQAATGAAKTVAKEGGEAAAKVGGTAAAEEGGTVAGGETALGVLDAIPGADIIGIIGGAILTGVEAHKHNKLAKSIRNAAQGLPNFSVSSQVGSFGN